MKIAFVSCSKIQRLPEQRAWASIKDEKPDHLLLLGDNVYSKLLKWSHKKLEKRYIEQFAEPNFNRLIQEVPFNAIWDDHDFGPNNVKGGHVPAWKKNKSRDLFHKYMNCSTNLPHVYHSFEIGDAKVIMLDTRYYREKPRSSEDATILGADQERWFEGELGHQKRYTIVCAGSCLSKGGERLEKYNAYYPRLISMLKNKGRSLFLSGDIHKNRFVSHDGFYEAISSGVGRPNRNNYGIVEFLDGFVDIKFVGDKKRDNSSWRINAATWDLINQ